MSVSNDYDYTRFTPLDSSGEAYDQFKSAYKNIRFALPTVQTVTVKESDIGNLAGLAFRVYGDVSMWRMILAFNGLQDAIQDMWAGQILNLPAKAAVIAYLNEQLHSQQQTFTI
jgi:hypothetical protein